MDRGILGPWQRSHSQSQGQGHWQGQGQGRGRSRDAFDGNKRKRDTQTQYIASMIQGNPKMLLADSPLFNGFTQHELPFIVSIASSFDQDYQARIRLPLPDGSEAWGIGMARTKKEAERVAAIDACKKLNEKGLLVGASKNTLSNSGWGDNPKNILVTSVSFRDVCCGANARSLPIRLRSTGPDHSKVFVAELVVPIPNKECYIAVGEGRNKAEAERACCTAACEKLNQEGLLDKPGQGGHNTANTNISLKALQIQQQNERPAIVGLRDEELLMMEDALRRLHLEMENTVQSTWENPVAPGMEDVVAHSGALEMTPSYVSAERRAAENSQFCTEARNRMTSPEFKEQNQVRQSLPAWAVRNKVVETVQNNRVVVLTGETGCGKTTQVPQFLLEESEMQGVGAEVHIVVTQPRRIAAISVAERVAWERGEPLGKSVGYTIRLESVPPRHRGSILYCTTGILLRRLQKNDGLSGVTHVILDEVHERDVDTDFLLVVVRELLQHHPSLRVVIMSATLDASIFTRYFGGCPAVNIPGRIYPVQLYFLEDMQSLMGQHCFPVTRCLRQQSFSDDEEVDVELVAFVVSWVAQRFDDGKGAILCFLPGWDDIISVKERLMRMPGGKNMMIVPLHSQLPAGEQRAAFARAPAGLQKVVLATNIAETSVTIDDVVYVVDSGKIKQKQFDISRNMTTMRVQWTSQASARQRQGRAGRVRAGFCFRLYTKHVYASMLEHQVPEMQQVPLEELCLQIKAIATPNAFAEAGGGIAQQAQSALSDIASFLSKALQPPRPVAVQTAIKVLQDLGAIDQYQRLTPLGRTLAQLAVHPRFGKMLVYGAFLGCLDPLLTLAAAACFRDPFVSPVNKRDEADRVRESFAVGAAYGSDQLALMNAFEQWSDANTRGQGNAFADANFLAPNTMKLIAGMRKQFEKTLAEARILEPWVKSKVHQASVHIARSLLAAGLYPNIARSDLCRESKGMKNATKHAYRYRLGFKVQNSRVFIHPTSVICEKQLNPDDHYYLVFQEKVQTSQVYVRGCTLLPPLAIALLGWNVIIGLDPPPKELSGDWMVLEVEGWLKFLIDRKAGLLLLQLRHAFETVLSKWIGGSVHTQAECYVVEVVVALLEATCVDMFLTSKLESSNRN